MIKFQQSQALTSHFESFWSIVTWMSFVQMIICNWRKRYNLKKAIEIIVLSCYVQTLPPKKIYTIFDVCSISQKKETFWKISKGWKTKIITQAKVTDVKKVEICFLLLKTKIRSF